MKVLFCVVTLIELFVEMNCVSPPKDTVISASSGKSYTIGNKLGESLATTVRKVIDTDTNGEFAGKFTMMKDHENEITVLTAIGTHVGFPKMIDHGSHEGQIKSCPYYFLVISELGQDLQKFFEQKKYSLIMDSVLEIGDQLLQRLEFFHGNKNTRFLHLGLKPANMCFGVGANKNTIYLIDFEHSMKMSQEGGKFTRPINTAGAIDYLPIAALRNQKASFVDELESVVYLLMYFANADTEWPRSGKIQDVLEMKTQFWKTEESIKAGLGNRGAKLLAFAKEVNSLRNGKTTLDLNHLSYANLRSKLNSHRTPNAVFDWMPAPSSGGRSSPTP